MRGNGELAAFDPRTGEIYGTIGKPKKRGRHPYGYSWHMVDSEEYDRLLRVLKRGQDCRVFAALPSLMLRGNWLVVPATAIAARLEIHRNTVQNALDRLRAEWVIGEVNGARQFNPNIAWKGRTADLRVAINTWDRAIAAQLEARRAPA